jgi:hypothetical protein
MEQLINTVVTFVLGIADKYQVLSTICLVIGGLYGCLSALRGILTIAVKLTKTDKDDKIIATIFAFCDKFAYGFGQFAEYFENHSKKEK